MEHNELFLVWCIWSCLIWVSVFLFFYNITGYNETRQKINEKYITKKINKKETENTAEAHISLLSQIEQWKKSWQGVDVRGKNEYIFKAKERNNIKKIVLKIYL